MPAGVVEPQQAAWTQDAGYEGFIRLIEASWT